MASDADYAAMAYARGNRDPNVVRLVEEAIREDLWASASKYTHIGGKANVAYQNRGRLYGHSAPKAGKRHALNRDRGDRFVALCGEIVHDNDGRDEHGEPTDRTVFWATSESDARINCKRCRLCIEAARKG